VLVRDLPTAKSRRHPPPGSRLSDAPQTHNRGAVATLGIPIRAYSIRPYNTHHIICWHRHGHRAYCYTPLRRGNILDFGKRAYSIRPYGVASHFIG
ncbi:MAG: hypothetical protein ACI4AH_04220, partial [Muribaculaceae bacterium]